MQAQLHREGRREQSGHAQRVHDVHARGETAAVQQVQRIEHQDEQEGHGSEHQPDGEAELGLGHHVRAHPVPRESQREQAVDDLAFAEHARGHFVRPPDAGTAAEVRPN